MNRQRWGDVAWLVLAVGLAIQGVGCAARACPRLEVAADAIAKDTPDVAAEVRQAAAREQVQRFVQTADRELRGCDWRLMYAYFGVGRGYEDGRLYRGAWGDFVDTVLFVVLGLRDDRVTIVTNVEPPAEDPGTLVFLIGSGAKVSGRVFTHHIELASLAEGDAQAMRRLLTDASEIGVGWVGGVRSYDGSRFFCLIRCGPDRQDASVAVNSGASIEGIPHTEWEHWVRRINEFVKLAWEREGSLRVRSSEAEEP